MSKKNAALEMAIISFEAIMKAGLEDTQAEILQCKEALESQEIGDAEIRQMLNDIEYYQKRVEELESQKQEYDINEMIDKITPENLQEPVAWMYRGNLHEFDPSDWATEPVIPLYTHPAQPLSDDEIASVIKTTFPVNVSVTNVDLKFARAIEQALKEKNT